MIVTALARQCADVAAEIGKTPQVIAFQLRGVHPVEAVGSQIVERCGCFIFDHTAQSFGTAECEVSPVYAVYGSRP